MNEIIVEYVEIDRLLQVKNAYFLKEKIKRIAGASWEPIERVWKIPVTKDSIEALQSMMLDIPSGAFKQAEAVTRKMNYINKLKEELEPKAIELMPIKVKPYKHQIRGFNIAGKILGIFNHGG